MCFKKNGVSYFIWLIFLMSNCVVFSFLGMLCARVFTDSVPVAGLTLTAVFFALLFLVYILSGILVKKISKKESEIKKDDFGRIRKRLILEGILAVVFLTAGICIRIFMLPAAGESAAYYDVAKVSQEPADFIVPVHSSVYYYLCLLRGLFLLLGNHWIAGIWMQIVLQILSCMVLYFVIRKMGGIITAMGVLIYAMFSPYSIAAGLTYSPQMLYNLLWAFGLLSIVLTLNFSTKGGEKESLGYNLTMWLAVVLSGVFAGFLGYVDVSGFVLGLPLLYLPRVCRKCERKLVWFGRTFLGILAVAGGFFGSIYVDSLISKASFVRVLNAWLTTFKADIPNVVTLLQNSSLEVVILLVVMAVNVFSFYRRKETEVFSVWMLMTFVLALLYVLGITAESMNGRPLLLILMSVVATIGVRELFAVSPVVEVAEDKETGEEVMQENVIGENILQNEEPEKEKPRFLENPLPLPKKHVRKTMEYAFVPESSQMKYDVEVNDTDDYDV